VRRSSEGQEEAQGGARRLAVNGTKTTIRATEEVRLINMLTDVRTKFNALKPNLEKIMEEYNEDGEIPSATEIVTAADKAVDVGASSRDTDHLYSTSSRTTTSIPLYILAPIPLTGRWDAGRTMRASTLVAEDMINYQQQIIPGHAVYNQFFDDKCNAQEGMRLVLQESASVTMDYVALGGIGCSEVCADTAFAAASMNMPFLSYECSGRALSDETAYEGLTRMGTPLTSMPMLEAHADVGGYG